jgi:hypothetical protein
VLRNDRRVDLMAVADSWAVGLVDDGGTMVSLRVNRAIAVAAPFADFPWQVGVRIAFNAPTETGFCSPEEDAEVRAIEDRLVASLRDRPPARLCVSLTSTKSHRDLAFHATSNEWVEAWANEVQAASTGHRLAFGSRHDPEWIFVRQCGEKALAADGDRQAIARIAEQGVDLSVPQQIEHTLLFPDEVSASSAGAALAQFGFQVEVVLAGGVWSVTATRHERLTQGVLAKVRRLLTMFATEQGGEFDGWGVALTPNREP